MQNANANANAKKNKCEILSPFSYAIHIYIYIFIFICMSGPDQNRVRVPRGFKHFFSNNFFAIFFQVIQVNKCLKLHRNTFQYYFDLILQ